MAALGYAGKILRVDLSSGNTTEINTADYANRFLGGRGIAAKIYWDEVSPEIKALDPENRLIFATGPLAGLPAIAGSRWQVCGKSPACSPEHFCYANLGGTWAAQLKFTGYDAIIVQGKSDKPVYLVLNDGNIEIRDATTLWGKGAVEARETLKSELGNTTKVVAIGPAGENMVVMATLLADKDASGSGGLGAVMGSKNLKAIAIGGTKKGVNIAKPDRFRELLAYFRTSRQGVPMGAEDLAPGLKVKRDLCYGCIGSCIRKTYEAENGNTGKFVCQAGVFYLSSAAKYYETPGDVPFFATKLCDNYGIDTQAIEAMLHWLWECYQADILTDKDTGIPLSKFGSFEFIETLVRKISFRDGFGDILAHGTVAAADLIGTKAKEQVKDIVSKAGALDLYGPRLYNTAALLYATEPRMPIQQLHQISFPAGKWLNWANKLENSYVSPSVIRSIAKRFWGSEIAADFSTYEGKGLAAKMIQDREYAKECLIVCDWLWPILDVEHSDDHAGDPAFESKVLAAVTGNEMDEEGLCHIGERVFNLQRAILAREGHRNRASDSLPNSFFTVPLHRLRGLNPEGLVPGKEGQVLSRKGAVVDREGFEKMKDEYYQSRQWDVATGLQTKAKLAELELEDITPELEQRGLVL